MENMDKGLTVPKCVLIVKPKIPQMSQNLSAHFVCPSQKILDFKRKKASLGVRSPWFTLQTYPWAKYSWGTLSWFILCFRRFMWLCTLVKQVSQKAVLSRPSPWSPKHSAHSQPANLPHTIHCRGAGKKIKIQMNKLIVPKIASKIVPKISP